MVLILNCPLYRQERQMMVALLVFCGVVSAGLAWGFILFMWANIGEIFDDWPGPRGFFTCFAFTVGALIGAVGLCVIYPEAPFVLGAAVMSVPGFVLCVRRGCSRFRELLKSVSGDDRNGGG
jgi:hypothetical protein